MVRSVNKKSLLRFTMNKTGMECHSEHIIPVFRNVFPCIGDNRSLSIVPHVIIVMIYYNHLFAKMRHIVSLNAVGNFWNKSYHCLIGNGLIAA